MQFRPQSMGWLYKLATLLVVASIVSWGSTLSAVHADDQSLETPGALDEEEPPEPEAVEYYIDGKTVPESEATAYSQAHFFGVFGAKDNPKDRIMRIHYFSSEELKLEFADAEDIPLRRCQEAEAHLAEYAESSGAIRAYEATGIVPESFTNYAREYTALHRPGGVQGAASLSFGHYGKDFFGGSTLIMFGGHTPAFILGWDNAISRYFVWISPLLVYSYISFWDKTFYRSPRIWSVWNWNHNTVRFQGPYASVNDRASSVFTF